MYLLRTLRSARSLAALALAVLLAGCGGSGNSGSSLFVDPLTNPDVVLLGSGRAADASWHFYAMNPDGSSVTPVSGLNSLDARLSRSVVVNQNATFADIGGKQVGPEPVKIGKLLVGQLIKLLPIKCL